MKRILLTLSFATIVSLSLGGCASTLGFVADVTGTEIVSDNVRQGAYKAALVTFVAWGGAPSEECKRGEKPAAECIGGIQELVYKYGKLTPCGQTASVICRDQKAWDKIKGIEAATTATLASLEPAIASGTDDVQLLVSVPTVVQDAHAAIQKAIKGE